MTIAHLLMGINLIGIRRKVEHSSWKCTNDQYNLLCADLDNALYYLELDSLIGGKFKDQEFDKLRVLKLMGMTINVRFSNILEQCLHKSVY